jgi:beta-N-acetylhexosaminidase
MTAQRSRAIFGCAGPKLNAEERKFFQQVQPWGFILFGRNIVDRGQIKNLVSHLRETVSDPSAPVLIDQEGGRVARLQPPQWKARPPALRFAELHATAPEEAREAAYINARIIANDLIELGINVDCLPVLDVPVEGADDIIGDRAYGRDPAVIIDLGRAVIEGMMAGGVAPVMKHIPGHGRATADSHLSLPRVDTSEEQLSATDFVTFRSLNHCPMAMTAHVVYEAIDPQRPATTSPKLIRDVIRGQMGFDGLLMSDDLSMQALTGSLDHRAKASLFAGCDVVLHCNGSIAEMREIAPELKPLEDIHLKRAHAALAHLGQPEDFDAEAAEARLAALLGTVA